MKPCHIADLGRSCTEISKAIKIIQEMEIHNVYQTEAHLHRILQLLQDGNNRIIKIIEYEALHHSPHNIEKDKEI